MKYFIIASVLFFISCREEKKPHTTYIISGKDTIAINGYFGVRHLSSPCGSHGERDTTTGILSITFIPCDDIRVTGIGFETDSAFKLREGINANELHPKNYNLEPKKWKEKGGIKPKKKKKLKPDTLYLDVPIIIDTFDDNSGIVRPIKYEYAQEFDSAKYYWKKQLHFEKLRDREMERINSYKSPKLSRKAIQLTDSIEKYKALLKK